MRNRRILSALILLASAGLAIHAQTAAKQPLSVLKPPSGAKVAIVEFDDLECPSCAHAVPILEAAAAKYKIPVVHHDYPLVEIHTWSFDAAVTARYLEDSVSPKLAHEFRREVFANQNMIASKDDLASFTQRWFQAHHQPEPFVMDASGNCTREVKADRALGDSIGNNRTTPCIYVVTATTQTKLKNVDELYAAVDAALAQEAVAPRNNARRR
jgi:protein-disulfide isomerase